MIAGATAAGICLLEFTDRPTLAAQVRTLRRRVGEAFVPGEHAHLATLRGELAAYFAGAGGGFTVPLDAPGSPFQERVWTALLGLRRGETVAYEDLAARIGAPGAQRATGTANGCNRIAIVVPCHRVVRKDGRPGGYAGGWWRKAWLLAHERAAAGAR